MCVRLRLDGRRYVRSKGRLGSLPLRVEEPKGALLVTDPDLLRPLLQVEATLFRHLFVGVARLPDLDAQLRHHRAGLRVLGNLTPPILREPDHVRHLHSPRGLHGKLDCCLAGGWSILVEQAKDTALKTTVKWGMRTQDKLTVSVRLNFEGEIPQLRIV